METIVCKCRVITPMFSSGANQTKCEIRVPEIKAAMRFWWRAANSNLKLDELKRRETLIFGGSGDEEARKSSFTMRVENVDYKNSSLNWDALNNIDEYKKVYGTKERKRSIVNLFDYLAYGVKNKYDAIKPKTTFDLVVRVDPECKRVNKKTKKIEVVQDINPIDEVKKALELFSCFGSIGARSRNGFGKVIIDGYETNVADLCICYCKIKSILPSYTAFSKNASLFKTKEACETWHEALFEIGKAYRAARVGEDGKKGLLGDHYSGENRQYISLPLSVMSLRDRQKQNPNKDDYDRIKLKQLRLERMAKQFFMIVEPENGGFVGYILHLPFDIEQVSRQCNKQMWLEANNAMKQQLGKYLEEIEYD